jgi:GH25 family lysozyme M1 (1,4-beta-N-acetylmuramidase)
MRRSMPWICCCSAFAWTAFAQVHSPPASPATTAVAASGPSVANLTTAHADPQVPTVQNDQCARNPNADGAAQVIDAEHLPYVKYFAAENTQDLTRQDPRLTQNVRDAEGNAAVVRSIAILAAVGNAPNAPLPAAEEDLQSLCSFFVNDQHFDEVIALKDAEVTVENLRYFLVTYAENRGLTYRSMVRFVFAFSGHAVPDTPESPSNSPSANVPTIKIVMGNTVDDQDFNHLLAFPDLRGWIQALYQHSYHVAAFVNTCFSGALFDGVGPSGFVDDIRGPGIVAVAATDKNHEVLSAPDNRGSLFFEALIRGVQTGHGDTLFNVPMAGEPIPPNSKAGVVRASPLASYIEWQMQNFIDAYNPDDPTSAGNKYTTFGPLEPLNVPEEGEFFFLHSTDGGQPTSFIERPKQRVAPADSTVTNIAQSMPIVGSLLDKVQREMGQLTESASAQICTTLKRKRSTPPRASPQHRNKEGPDGFELLREGVKQPIRGADVSRLDGDIDWGAAAQAIQFVYVRSTTGSSYVDPTFFDNWQGALQANLPRGAYHTFSFCASADDQASNIFNHVPVEPQDLPVAIDVEELPAYNPSLKSEVICAEDLGSVGFNAHLSALAKKIAVHYGKKPVIYAPPSVRNQISDDIVRTYPMWQAGFSPDRQPVSPWTIWQYTEYAKVPGIKRPVDLDILNGTGFTNPED